MSNKVWAYDPQSGGQKIPPAIQPRIRQRILDHADKHYAGRFNRIDVRFRGQFCYIDAYTEPYVAPDFDPSHLGESREHYIARLRATPTHLCRLRYFGREDSWSMAFYTYSQNKYEPCFFPDGGWEGTPEAAFDTASVYLEP
ncbi:hypothetical protein [Allochromatium palmeri]|uniref:Uncharacterized protein n=1 Tax=Allochromatium palmeri TaxID=231048 RepID=A0A6N8EG32_9GAMM|nr:hypothetical protein [Allochromatium palmeri]MTW21304.1 hypothetical protein [Allochromatium palmeri]